MKDFLLELNDDQVNQFSIVLAYFAHLMDPGVDEEEFYDYLNEFLLSEHNTLDFKSVVNLVAMAMATKFNDKFDTLH